jgi:hypothetical protein
MPETLRPRRSAVNSGGWEDEIDVGQWVTPHLGLSQAGRSCSSRKRRSSAVAPVSAYAVDVQAPGSRGARDPSDGGETHVCRGSVTSPEAAAVNVTDRIRRGRTVGASGSFRGAARVAMDSRLGANRRGGDSLWRPRNEREQQATPDLPSRRGLGTADGILKPRWSACWLRPQGISVRQSINGRVLARHPGGRVAQAGGQTWSPGLDGTVSGTSARPASG